MVVGVVKESQTDERRVALVPSLVQAVVKSGATVLVEPGAGAAAGFLDAAYQEKGATIGQSRADVLSRADVVLRVRLGPSGHPATDRDLGELRAGQAVIAFLDPLSDHALIRALAERQVSAFSMELMPRITRAQSMDALSSMATISGYKAVLLAAVTAPRMFPMLITAAGSVAAARTFVDRRRCRGAAGDCDGAPAGVTGAGVRRPPGGEGTDHEPGREGGGRPIEAPDAQDKGGYAKAQDEAFYARQREAMAKVVAGSDVVVTTAAIPGRRSPILITAPMVAGMQPGSVIVDLAAERGGNCELTRADETVVTNGVTILGPTNLPSTVPYHASQMYAKNITTFLKQLTTKDGELAWDFADEITKETLVTHKGDVVHERVRGLVMAKA